MALPSCFRLEIRGPALAIETAFAALIPLASAGSISSLEQVQMTVYYPAPSGAYQQMLVNGNAYLATLAAGSPNPPSVQFGAIQPIDSSHPPQILVNKNVAGSGGNMAIDALGAPVNGGLYMGPPNATGGEHQILLQGGVAGTGEVGSIDAMATSLSILGQAAGPLVALGVDPQHASWGLDVSYLGLDFPGNPSAGWPQPPSAWPPTASLDTSKPYSSVTFQNLNSGLALQAPWLELPASANYDAATNVDYDCKWVAQSGWPTAMASCGPVHWHMISGGGECFMGGLGHSWPSSSASWEVECTNPVFGPTSLSTAYALCCRYGANYPPY